MKDKRNEETRSDGKELVLSYSGNILKHLGINMYASLPAALAELIANSYDANAENVKIFIKNNPRQRELPMQITVCDDGEGMSFSDINDYFLNVGNNRRKGPLGDTTKIKNRKITGKKGLGKFALFGLTDKIEINTTQKDSVEIVKFILNWKEMTDEERELEYKPFYEIIKNKEDKQYTKVILRDIKGKKRIDINVLAKSVSFLLDFFSNDFSVELINVGDNSQKIAITNRTRYDVISKEKIQKEWIIPQDINIKLTVNGQNQEIKGEIYASKTPFTPMYRGISIMANKRMINAPSFFEKKESSHFFSYISGWLEINFLDDYEEELISTNRQSLNWEHEFISDINLKNILHEFLKELEQEWRKLRITVKEKEMKTIGADNEAWVERVSEKYREPLSEIIDILIQDDSISPQNLGIIITLLKRKIIPPYAELFWFNLDKRITQDKNVFSLYKEKRYYEATDEANKVFIANIQKLSGVVKDGASLIRDAIKHDKDAPIEITKKRDKTERNIERSFQDYLFGVHYGYRNVKSHTPIERMKELGIEQKDCLMVLDVLSRLYAWLDKRKKPPRNK